MNQIFFCKTEKNINNVENNLSKIKLKQKKLENFKFSIENYSRD